MGRYASRRPSSKAKKQRVTPSLVGPSLDGESMSSVSSSVSFLWMPDSTFPEREDSKSSDVDDADESTGADDSAGAVIAGSHRADDRSRGVNRGEEDRGNGHTVRSLEVEVMSLKLQLAEACTSDGRRSHEARTLALERDGLLERVDDLTRERDAALEGWWVAQGECRRLKAGTKRLRAENEKLKMEKAEALARERDLLKVRAGGGSGCCCAADEMSHASACFRSVAPSVRGSSLVGRPFQATGPAEEDGSDGNFEGDDEESGGDGEGGNGIPDGLACGGERQDDEETGREDHVAPAWRLFGRRVNAKESPGEKDGDRVRDCIAAGKWDGANGNDESDAKNDSNGPGTVKDASSLSARFFHKRDNDKEGNAKDDFDSRPDNDENVHPNRSFRGLGLFGRWSDRTLAGNGSVDAAAAAARDCPTAMPNDASGMRDVFRTSKSAQSKPWNSDHRLSSVSSRPNPASQSLQSLFCKRTQHDDATARPNDTWPNDASGLRTVFQTSKGAQEGRPWKSDHQVSASRPNPAAQSLRNLFGKPTAHRHDDANVGTTYENFAMDNDNNGGSAVSSVHAGGRSVRDVFRSSFKMIRSMSDPKLFTFEDSLSEDSDIIARRAGTGQETPKNGGTNSSAEVWGKAVTWNQIQRRDAKMCEPILRRRSVELCD